MSIQFPLAPNPLLWINLEKFPKGADGAESPTLGHKRLGRSLSVRFGSARVNRNPDPCPDSNPLRPASEPRRRPTEYWNPAEQQLRRL